MCVCGGGRGGGRVSEKSIFGLTGQGWRIRGWSLCVRVCVCVRGCVCGDVVLVVVGF